MNLYIVLAVVEPDIDYSVVVEPDIDLVVVEPDIDYSVVVDRSAVVQHVRIVRCVLASYVEDVPENTDTDGEGMVMQWNY